MSDILLTELPSIIEIIVTSIIDSIIITKMNLIIHQEIDQVKYHQGDIGIMKTILIHIPIEDRLRFINIKIFIYFK